MKVSKKGAEKNYIFGKRVLLLLLGLVKKKGSFMLFGYLMNLLS